MRHPRMVMRVRLVIRKRMATIAVNDVVAGLSCKPKMMPRSVITTNDRVVAVGDSIKRLIAHFALWR